MSRENELFERKLNPIYDALQIRNFKSALKLIDAALKKHKGNQVLRSLKAYAMAGSGHKQEAIQVLTELTSDGPESERVLHVMTMSYKILRRTDAIITAYAAAAERHPNNVEIATGLFGAYARTYNYVKQQQLALKLAKSAPPASSDQFAWWAVCSVFLQAREGLYGGSTALPPAKLMQLAMTMAERQAAKATPTYEALLLHLDILQGLGGALDAVAKVETAPDAAIPMPGDRLHLKAAALARAGDLPAAAQVYKAACIQNPDDWLCWSLYLDCMLPGTAAARPAGGATCRYPVGIVTGLAEAWDSDQGGAVWKEAAVQQDGASITQALESAALTLQEMQDAAAAESSTGNGFRKNRGMAVAGPELALRKVRLRLPEAEIQLAGAVADALPVLCDAFSCVADLQIYLTALQDKAAKTTVYHRAVELSQENQDSTNSNGTNNNTSSKGASISALQRHVNAYKLGEELGLPDLPSSAAAEAHAQTLVALYAKNQHLSEGLDPKDRGYGEDLLAMAAGALIRAYVLDEGHPPRFLLLAILTLEAAQVRRQVSAPLRLCSTALCGVLGMPHKAAQHFAALDIKSILHATMSGHWVVPALLAASDDENLPRWLNGIISLHTDQVVEAGDALVAAYTHGTYSKVPEFIEFLQRLQRSHPYASAQVELLLTQLRNPAKVIDPGALRDTAHEVAIKVQQGDGSPLTLAASGRLRFIEDVSMRPAWFPPSPRPGHLSAGQWWKDLAPAQPGTQCWWTAPGSNDGQGPDAQQWRDWATTSVRVRAVLPGLLAAASTDNPMKQEELDALDKQIIEYKSVIDALDQPSQLNLLLLHLGHAVKSTHQALTSLQQGNGLPSDVHTSVSTLQDAVKSITAGLLESFKAPTSLLLLPTNSAVSEASSFITEGAPWTSTCLLGCLKAIKATEKKIGADSAAKLQQMVNEVCKEVLQGVVAIKDCIDGVAAVDVPSHAGNVLGELIKVQGAEAMWGYEDQFDPESALIEALNDQKGTAVRLQTAAALVVKVLKPR